MRIQEEIYAKKSAEYFGSHSTLSSTNEEIQQLNDDVVFVSSKESEAANLWINYLTACFEQISRQQGRPPFRVKQATVEESCATSVLDGVQKSRLQIIVVCPVLLERAGSQAEQVSILTKRLIPERVLGMMLGVHESHVNETQKASLVTYHRWNKFFVKDQDETFVGEFLREALSILGTVSAASSLKSDKTAFSVHPKKVKLSQNRVIALLNEPLHPEDNVVVSVDRCGESLDVASVKRRNPYTLQFSIPERCLDVSMLIGVRIFRNGCPLGVRQIKCESRLRELDQILRAHDNPLEFICQTFGFNPGDREQLDSWMVHAFQRNIPPNFNLLSTPSGMVHTHKNQSSPEENPTLLHFAARFGLERLAWQLLECPGGDVACELRNVAELTPAELAEKSGHARLAHQLRSHMQMNEFSNVYSYVKVISEKASDTTEVKHPSTKRSNSMGTGDNHKETKGKDETNEKEDYCRPRALSDAYSVPPAARPVTSLFLPGVAGTPLTANSPIGTDYSIVPPPMPVEPVSSTDNSFRPSSLQGYVRMCPAPGGETEESNVTGNDQAGHHMDQTAKDTDFNAAAVVVASSSNNSYPGVSKNGSLKRKDQACPQDELLEIINDFKNNVFTISEVERLVDNWKNRNDVQQSFKDKQRQLMAMREEYERIQKRIKDDMRAPTPFDRIRKFFSKGKKDGKDAIRANEEIVSKLDGSTSGLGDHRPVSSLSLRSISSSSSSGRMSIASGCSGASLGDSGTHSDPEDKRLQSLREDKSSLLNYEIPPAPKPFSNKYSSTPRYTPSPRCPTEDNHFDFRTALAQTDQYYLSFPMSALSSNSLKEQDELPTPCSPSDNILGDRPKFNSTNYVNVESNLSPKIMLRPPTGLCIPANYTNIDPSNEKAQTFQELAQVHRNDSAEPITVTETTTADTNSEMKSTKEICRSNGEIEKIVGETSGSEESKDPAEIIDTDQLDGERWNNQPIKSKTENAISNDKTETLDSGEGKPFPDYMNVTTCLAEDIDKSANIPKKRIGPPVPPRTTSSK
ncbi:phosphoinositide 3-kinase adapter protein 1-like isoform X2 [Prorops nasuta]|uniref:phosphoinositide 3-kinase adapter protein 1-like isoform X2 n=1 Tax=Prorops nasuta TaxID=863751 RepID=UPI0034CD6154